uniref:Kinesin-like protein n=1 Tax=Graphocephala atropunctata TaxID=36148 RepID=A0A1B6LAW8_9HEMI
MPVSINNQSTSTKGSEMVKVVVRCRPMNEKEIAMGCLSVIKMNPLEGEVEVYDAKHEKTDCCKLFSFDGVYDYKCTQQEIYNGMVMPLVNSFFSGFNCTVFAYGQSNAGKTYTMEGSLNNNESKGIIPKTFDQIFDHITNSFNMQYLVRASYLEIYQDEIRDLLNIDQNKKHELRESKELGVYVKNITSMVCKNTKQMLKLMLMGQQRRSTGTTDVNVRSSRSHAIVTVTVEMRDTGGPLENRVRVGKLNLVDLAGSERQSKTNAEGKRLKEASKINLSLTALSSVISALASGKELYVPYRDSKLTRLLRDSLGGNSKTLMIATIGPADFNYFETLSTLRYASRARNIQNKPRINEDPVDALIRKYQEEILKLKSQLAEKSALKERRFECETYLKSNIASNKIPEDRYLVHTPTNIESATTNLLRENEIRNGKDVQLEEKREFEAELDNLLKRIELMESKLLSGSNPKSSSILDHTHEQQRALSAKCREIEASKQREKEMHYLLELKYETAGEIKKVYSSLQQEVEMKSNQLKQMYHKLERVRQDIHDVTADFNTDRRELEIMDYDLLKDLKLKLLILESFIPNEDRRRIFSKIYFDEELHCWRISPDCEERYILSKLQCFEYMRRPASMYTIFTSRKVNHIYRCNQTQKNKQNTFRFKEENILELNFVGSTRTTKDYQIIRDRPDKLDSILETALQEEDDIDIDAANPIFRSYSVKTRRGNRMCPYPSNGQIKQAATMTPTPVYPKARGLVPK